MNNLQKKQAAGELLKRREARREFRAWCVLLGFQPAKHHDLVISKIQEMAESATPKYVIIEMPPGSAKSTYVSVLCPPWFLGKKEGSSILACSYSKDLVTSFGRRCRNYVDENKLTLGYELKEDTRAADEWETSNKGRYFCAGVGAGIAGHRADLGMIDDYLGNQEDADSKLVRDKQFDWFKGDFYPRLKPNASILIMANRRHEDDLIGRLTKASSEDFTNDSPIPPEAWEIIRIPFFAEQDDVLGRAIGERLWPEWFTEQMAEQIKRINPRIRSGLYQQRPSPEEGDFFKSNWLVPYRSKDELPKDLRVYSASDHAVSLKDEACKSCMGSLGVDSNGELWLLPEIFWKRADANSQVEGMIWLNSLHKPIFWRAEKGHIMQSIEPFLMKRMRELGVWINLRQVNPKRDKPTRARAIQGFCATGRVHVPTFADWWPEAENQLLNFPGSRENDFVDMFSHLGNEVVYMTNPQQEYEDMPFTNQTTDLTYGWIKDQRRRQERLQYADN